MKAKLNALTSLRFFAAIMIVVLHIAPSFPKLLSWFPENLILRQGVSFFFILSGFILTYSYSKLESKKETIFFICKRIARIWPLHMATLLIFVLGCGPILKMPLESWLITTTNILMVHAWVPSQDFCFSFNSPSWSISTEFFFYLSMPLLLVFLARPTKLLFASACLLLTLISIATVNGNPDLSLWLLYISPIGRLFEFILGLLLADKFLKNRSRKDLSFKKASIIEGISIALVLLAIFNTTMVSAIVAASIGEAGKCWIEDVGMTIVPFSLLIFISAMNRGFVSKALSIRPLVFLGEISFAIYLVHVPLRILWDFWVPSLKTSITQECLLLAVFVTLVLTLSHLLYSVVERPCQKFLTEFASSLLYGDRNKNPYPQMSIPTLFRRFKIPLAEGSLLICCFVVYSNTSPFLEAMSEAKMPTVKQQLLQALMTESLNWKASSSNPATIADYFQNIRKTPAYLKLTAKDQIKVMDSVSAQYLLLSYEHISRDRWMKYYKSYRASPNAPYHSSTSPDWEFVDYNSRQNRSIAGKFTIN